MTRKKIALLGSSQIQHIADGLSEDYDVILLQNELSETAGVLGKIARFVRVVISSDIVYNVYTTWFSALELLCARILGKKTVTHWIGTDVRCLVEGKTPRIVSSTANVNLVCFSDLQKDLTSCGIASEILPIVPFKMSFDLADVPAEHAVLVYLPDGREGDYGIEVIISAIEAFPTLSFIITANSSDTLFSKYDNVVLTGKVTPNQMDELYDKTTILLRLHKSDGLSMMVLEALAKGKKVIWDHGFPFALPGSSCEEVKASLSEILNCLPAADLAAHKFVCEEFSKKKFVESFSSIIARYGLSLN